MRLTVSSSSITVAFADHQKSTRVRWHILWISDDPKIASALHDSKASRRWIIEIYNQYVEIKKALIITSLFCCKDKSYN